MLRLLRAASVLAVLLFASAAGAQDREQDAERLFREGQKLLEERRYGEACPKFEQAYRKDGQLGTLLNLAFCHKEQGASWYAWLEFREAEVKAGEQKRTDRQEFAKKSRDELERALPKVILDGAQSHALTEVLVEDKRVPEAERGVYFTAEEGKRKFVFRAKGKKPATLLVSIGPKTEKLQHVAVPDLEDAPPEIVAPAPTATSPADRDVAKPPPSDDDPGKTQRVLGWTVLGVGGAAGIAVGTIFGLQTLNNPCIHFTDGSCKTLRPQEQTDQHDKAKSTALVSNIAFGVGAAAIVGGILLVVTAPSRTESKVGLDVGPGWLGAHGRF